MVSPLPLSPPGAAVVAVVLEPGDTDLQYKQLLNEREYREAYDRFGNTFEAAMGAEAIKKLLTDIDL